MNIVHCLLHFVLRWCTKDLCKPVYFSIITSKLCTFSCSWIHYKDLINPFKKKKPSVSTYFTRCTLQRDQLMSDSNAVSKSNFQGVFQFILDLTAAGQWQLCADSQLSFRWDRSALISVVLPTSAQRLPNPTLYNQHIITLFFPRLVCMPRCIKQFLNQKY